MAETDCGKVCYEFSADSFTITARKVKLFRRGQQPVLRVEAACSKRRKLDVLPIHPELLPILRTWLDGLESDEPLFPGLAKKKTWLMVKKDLERAGIPYRTKAGVADFHAAGRHTYVTELL